MHFTLSFYFTSIRLCTNQSTVNLHSDVSYCMFQFHQTKRVVFFGLLSHLFFCIDWFVLQLILMQIYIYKYYSSNLEPKFPVPNCIDDNQVVGF